MKEIKAKILFALLLLVSVGVGRAWGAELHANLASSYKGSNVTSYEKQDDGSYKLTWGAASDGVNVTYFESLCPSQGDNLSAYTGIRLNISECSKSYKLVIKANGTFYTKEMWVSGSKDFVLKTEFSGIDLTNVQDIYIAGNNGDGGYVIIKDIYLYSTDYTLTLLNTDGGSSTSKVTYDGTDYTADGTNSATVKVTDSSKSLSFTATPADGYLLWEWQTSTDGGSTWTDTWNASSPYTTTFSSNVAVRARFTQGIHVTASVDGSGTASIAYKSGGSLDNPCWLTPYKDLTFTATPASGYTFAGWYIGSTFESSDNPYTRQVQGSDVTLTAKFVSDAIYQNLDLSFTYGGETKTRQYRVYVPASVVSSSATNVPVVFSLHGTSNSNDPSVWGVQNYNDLAEANKFIVVYPQGRDLLLPCFDSANKHPGWEATGAYNEDIEFFKQIITDLGSRDLYKNDGTLKFTINTKRVYISGFSNGGMMAYACANAAPDVFAAFTSISGFPMNEMHLQHNGARPVPFMHIHGTKDDFVKYTYMPTIRDNMIFRNGCSMTPTVTTGKAYYWESSSNPNQETTFTRSEYTGGEQPYVFYEIGTGITSTDTGIGHTSGCTIGSTDSREIFWNFMSQYTLPETTETTSSDLEFSANISTTETTARDHGWKINDGGVNLAQYGESGGYTTAGQNVYHSIQLKKGTHYISFNVSGTSTNNVKVRLTRLAPLSAFDVISNTAATYTDAVVLDKTYNISGNTSICVKYDNSDDVASEYTLAILKGATNDNTTISNVTIKTTGTETSSSYEVTDAHTDFTGYYNYNNRLAAQWDFDLSDQYRLSLTSLNNSSKWTPNYDNADSNHKYGKVIYTYNEALGTSDDVDNYAELTYDGNTVIPVASGLKFYGAENLVKIQADISNGELTSAHLILESGVKMYIPHVENSYRNDAGSTAVSKETVDDFKNCMHHINRDILYFAMNSGNIFSYINNTNGILGGAGDEYINGKTFNKTNYTGTVGDPCVLQFTSEAVIDRIGVVRNLTYSFYPQYINDLGYTKPQPRMRIVGSPNGASVANTVFTGYNNAIAMTFGGWLNTSDESSYTSFSGSPVADSWGELAADANSTAVDGFSIISKNDIHATSESLMPSTTSGNTYHPACKGLFNIKGEGLVSSYTENFSPWTLPCRGGYLKFEPTIPGVLNVDVFQDKSQEYYIVDEFGKYINDDASAFMFTKSSATVTKGTRGYSTNADAYVKYSYNVYPGKTYYMFSSDAGIGLAGFYFEPYVYRTFATDETAREYVELKTTALTDGTDYVYDTSLDKNTTRDIESPATSGTVKYTIHSDNRAVTVSYDRSFTANKWNSICLPFSMNQNTMETVFGKGTRVVLLRDIQDGKNMESGKTTANFIMHENQDIIAGYPYFILPTQTVSSISTHAYIQKSEDDETTVPSIVSISSEGFNTNTGNGTYSGITDYKFTGTFNSVSVPAGTYYMSTTDGTLKRATKSFTMKPYRAYLASTASSGGAKALSAVFFGDTDDNVKEGVATDVDEINIDDVLFQNGILSQKANVYNMQGQIVLQNATNIQGLPKGAYIVNGKKFVVK